MTEIAVSGASGFIGRSVTKELLRRGVAATLIANSRGLDTAAGGFRAVQFDMADDGALDGLYEKLGRPRTLIHLAWGGLPNYESNSHFEVELPIQYRFLDALLTQGLKRVVVAGTCLEYGSISGALREDAIAAPHTPYGFAKNTLRQMLEFRQTAKPFELVWARLFYLFGDGQNPKSLYSQLQAAVAAGAAAFPMSGGEQVRDFSDVADVARVIVTLGLTDADLGIVNVCSGTPRTVRSLVEGWIKENNWSITPDLGRYPYPAYEPFAFWGDASKLQQIMGSEHAQP